MAFFAVCLAGLGSAASAQGPAAGVRVFGFTAQEADPAARQALGVEQGVVDKSRVRLGPLVVFLHGAGTSERCAPVAHLRLLAGFGLPVFAPCYVSDYEVERCGAAVAACRLEAFDGADRSGVIRVGPADSIERRIVMGLRHLDRLDPETGWAGFLAGDRPDWGRITLSGHSHGASTAALIGKEREVGRIVMLAGPYDRGQAWLEAPARTPVDRYFGFSHKRDRQHEGHLEAFARLGLPGAPVDVDRARAPYGGNHRLLTGAATDNPHNAVRAGPAAPEEAGGYRFEPVWRYLYGVPE